VTTEEIAAERLLTKTREAESFNVDQLLAVLAYASHGEQEHLFEAREEGAPIGKLGNSCWKLQRRAEEALR